MSKRIITKTEAQEIWDAYQDFDFLKDRFSTFNELWKWCQEYNELSELEWLILLFRKFNPSKAKNWIKEFEDQFVGEAADCIPEANWGKMKAEVIQFITFLVSKK